MGMGLGINISRMHTYFTVVLDYTTDPVEMPCFVITKEANSMTTYVENSFNMGMFYTQMSLKWFSFQTPAYTSRHIIMELPPLMTRSLL